MIKAPTKFLRDTKKDGTPAVYWVLAENESGSSPGKIHEVRTSKRDGKTYCTCRGWIVALNAGHSVCCHIRDYKLAAKTELVVMNKEDFAAFKRGISLIDAELGEDTNVVRRK
jgi:hypothetical protein